jgi:hypothetical protein
MNSFKNSQNSQFFYNNIMKICPMSIESIKFKLTDYGSLNLSIRFTKSRQISVESNKSANPNGALLQCMES